jgi:hypothetical protein
VLIFRAEIVVLGFEISRVLIIQFIGTQKVSGGKNVDNRQ